MREEIGLIASQRAKLLALLATFDQGAWSSATSCAPWDVRDVVAHLVDGELSLGPIYRGEVREQGYVDPETGIARWRALPGPAVAASLWQHGTAVQRVLEAMTEEAWRAPIRAFGCREIRQLVRLHLFELAVHGYDISTATGAQPHWDECMPFLVEFVVRAAPKTLARLKVAAEGALEVQAGGRAWTIDGRSGTWNLGTPPAPARMVIDPVRLVEAVTGRRETVEAMKDATVEGNHAMAERIFSAWRVLAQP